MSFDLFCTSLTLYNCQNRYEQLVSEKRLVSERSAWLTSRTNAVTPPYFWAWNSNQEKAAVGSLGWNPSFSQSVLWPHFGCKPFFLHLTHIPVWSRTHHKVVSMLNPNMHPNSTACLMQPMQVFLRLQRLRINHPGVRAQVHSWKQLHQLCGWRMKQSSLCLGCVSKMQNYCMRSWDDHEMIWCIDADDRTKCAVFKEVCDVCYLAPISCSKALGRFQKVAQQIVSHIRSKRQEGLVGSTKLLTCVAMQSKAGASFLDVSILMGWMLNAYMRPCEACRGLRK